MQQRRLYNIFQVESSPPLQLNQCSTGKVKLSYRNIHCITECLTLSEQKQKNYVSQLNEKNYQKKLQNDTTNHEGSSNYYSRTFVLINIW